MTRPHPIDIEIGKRIRNRRWQLGVTQQAIAEKCGVKFQQIQKYETGMNRVSASRLWQIAAALGWEAYDFFVGLEATAADGLLPETEWTREDYDDMAVIKSLTRDARRQIVNLARCFSAGGAQDEI